MWFAGFMKRHHKLSFRQPEITLLAIVSGFKEVVVHKIFDVLENIVVKNKITDSRIANMGETSYTVVQRPERIVAQKGKHQLEPSHRANENRM
jgi:hypothetical protein